MDGRFSQSNKEWAEQFEIAGTVRLDYDSQCMFVVESHPTVFDGFTHAFRQEYAVEHDVEQAPKREKQSLYETMEKARAQLKPKARNLPKSAKRKEPER